MMITTCTFFASHAKAAELVSKLLVDDPEIDYRVVECSRGFFVAIFENGEQVFAL